MDNTPYHVRLSVSQYGDKLKAELFTEDLGDTEGEFLPAQWQVMEEWIPYLSQGATGLPPDSARALGKELFSYLIGGTENSKKWVEILEQVKRQQRALRLLIDASTDHVRDLPYGLLCDPHDDYYLLRAGEGPRRQPIQFVRILRRCTPRLLNLNRNPLRVLIVAAEPVSAWLPAFACSSRLRDLVSALVPSFDVYALSSGGPQLLNKSLSVADAVPGSFFEPFCFARREDVQAALAQHDFDILHVIAHGQDGELLLCDESKNKIHVSPGMLGEWCSNSKVQIAFLQVCEAGKTSGRGGFGGLAQQLINPKCGNLAAVIASSYPLDAVDSTHAAINFYQGIAQGRSPDVALERNLDEDQWSWAFLELWVRPGALGGVTNRGAFQFVCPYRGLAQFEERNSDIFFGRDAETAELIQLLEGESMLTVVGDTGSGKSSLLQAGIVSTVRHKGLLGKENWEIVTVEPGGSLKDRLITALSSGTVGYSDAGDRGGRPWPDVLLELLESKSNESSSLILILDQFEEVFTLGENEAELHQLCDIIAGFGAQNHHSFRMILGLRTEYLGAAVSLRGVSKAVGRPFVLSPPVAKDLVDIVSAPARQYGYTFEDIRDENGSKGDSSLLRRILSDPILTRVTEDDSHAEPAPVSNPLPLLEFALERLWLLSVKRGAQEFKHEDYTQLGGLGGAIVKHAEEIYGTLPLKFGPFAQATAQTIFTELVSSSGTRRPRTRKELEAVVGDADLSRDITNYLVGERLLAIRSNPDNLSLSHVDLIHEVLIKRWNRLSNWLAVDPARRALIEAFEADAKKWSRQAQGLTPAGPDFLPGHSQAKRYMSWVNATKPSLTDDQRLFVKSLRRMLNRRKAFLGVVTTLIVGALLAAVVLWFQAAAKEREVRLQEREAHLQEREARVNLARRLQHQATIAINNKEMLEAELYSAQALTIEDQPEEQRRLRELLLEARAKGAAAEMRIRLRRIFLDADPSYSVIGTTTPEGELWLLDNQTGTDRFLNVRDPEINRAAISNDGVLLAYSTRRGEVKVIRISDEREIHRPIRLPPNKRGVPTPVTSLAFSGDTRLLAVGGNTGVIEILNLGSGPSKVLKGHEEPVHKLAFGPGNELLVSASSDDTVRLWDISAARQLRQFEGHEDVVDTIAFGPNMQVASGSSDGAIRIWNVSDVSATTDSEPKILTTPTGAFRSLSFSPDGRLLAAAGEDEAVRLFDLHANQEILKIKSFDGVVRKLTFTQDSRKLFAAFDGAVMAWTVVKDKEVRTLFTEDNGPMTSVAFSPGGNLLAAASHDSKVYIWDFKNKTTRETLRGAVIGRLNGVAYSPDGRILASTAEKIGLNQEVSPVKLWEVDEANNKYKEVKYWDVEDKRLKHGGYEAGVQTVAFSPTGEPVFATAGGYNDDVKFWNYRTKELLRVISYDTQVFNVAFSPDGQYFASGDDNGAVRLGKLWPAEGEGMPPTLYTHQRGVWGVAFSPAQPLLATGGIDKVVRVGGLNDGSVIMLPEESLLPGGGRQPRHTGGVYSVMFDPKGTWLAAASSDHTVTLWNLNNRQSLTLRMHGRPVWWVSFSPDGNWLASCSLDKRIQVWDMREINSVYNSDADDLLAEAKRETGLDLERGGIVLGDK
jgi:WD40 repeat protein